MIPSDKKEASSHIHTQTIASCMQSTLHSVKDNASTVDKDGVYLPDVMRKLGEDGSFYNLKTGLFHAVSHMHDVSAECMSTGFNMWCQSTLSWYLSRVNTSYWQDKHAQVASANILGGTGLSNPMKAFSGVAEIKLKGKQVDGGYVISGTLPWVSNVQYGHNLAVIFENQDGGHVMAIVHCCEDMVKITKPHTFIALEGTATVAVEFQEMFVSDSDILSTDVKTFLPNIRGGFVLLQCGMGLGILRRAIRILDHESSNPENQSLPVQKSDLQSVYDEIMERTQALCSIFDSQAGLDVHDIDSKYWKSVLELRRDISYATLNAMQNVMLHAGAKAYLQGSLAYRTLREGYFVSIITPSLKQLHLMIGDKVS